MEETKVKAAEQSAATSTIEVDGLKINVNIQARGSWDAVFMLRDINKLQKRYQEMDDGAERNEVVADALAMMLEYVCFTSDLTREKIGKHLGQYASVADVSKFIAQVLKEITSKN